MSIRVRMAMGLALAAILVTSIPVFAKGAFDFISITGPGLKGAVQITDASLTEEFFTFANFYDARTNEPAEPGQGYEITRHYKQGVSDVIFDRLHYYPETGFVFYDGIENGESEYDGEWYTANPDIKAVFESALAVQAGSPAQTAKEQPAAIPLPTPATLAIALTAGVAVLFGFAFWRRRVSAQ
jgi:hypothetical protein